MSSGVGEDAEQARGFAPFASIGAPHMERHSTTDTGSCNSASPAGAPELRSLEYRASASPHPRGLKDKAGPSPPPSTEEVNKSDSVLREDPTYLTERDLDAGFEAQMPLPRMQRARRTARRYQRVYFCNKLWWSELLYRSLPILHTVKCYRKAFLPHDIGAGLSAGASAIPIGMSYSLLARFPPHQGLYCQLFYCIIYMIFGTAQQACLGTSAIEAMLCAQVVAGIVGWGASPELWLNCCIGLSLMVGINLLILRVLCLGLISNFLPDPIVSSFSTACAITIALSQVQHFLGISVPRGGNLTIIAYVVTHLNEVRWLCVVIGCVALLIFVVLYRVNQQWFHHFPLPNSLLVMIIFILLGWGLKLDEEPFNVPVVGNVPRGFPQPKSFDGNVALILPLWRASLLYTFVYFFIHASVTRSVSQKYGYRIDSDQELLATGLCSFIGSFFQCYPVATSVARTSIACSSGAVTTLYNITNFLTIALTITILTPCLYYLPMAALASVVLFGVYFMLFFGEAWRLLRLFSADCLLWIVCFTVTVCLGPMLGICCGLGLSLLWILKDSAFPNTGVLGRLPGTKVFRDISTFTDAEQIPGIAILRFDAALNFSNAAHFEKRVSQLAKLSEEPLPLAMTPATPTIIRRRWKAPAANRSNMDLLEVRGRELQDMSQPSSQGGASEDPTGSVEVPSLRYVRDGEVLVVIVDASSITRVDVTAIRVLEQVACRLEKVDKVLLFANWKGPMRQFLEKARFYDYVPLEHCFLSLPDAVIWAERHLFRERDCAPFPNARRSWGEEGTMAPTIMRIPAEISLSQDLSD